ncbi:MAG TPA: HDOD domain-containing protein [Clostridia bacterium]|nr:HDOD domain-containing protein [Clostridia bacterium]
MDIYVARQPIFDRRLNLFGYELLYRRSMNNFYEGTDDASSTAALIDNTFLVIGLDELTGGARAFINFSEEFLKKEIPLLLPKENVVVEILETVAVSGIVVDACKKLKSLGYTLALDDFAFQEEYDPLIDLADIIKVEFPGTNMDDQLHLLQKYKKKKIFLAEKVETRSEYQTALQMGYDLFQGYFFSRPSILNSREIPSLSMNLIQILNELNEPEPDYLKISEIIEKDLGLSYKLLKMANSFYFQSQRKITSIHQALVRLGTQEMIQWTHLMSLKSVQTTENAELVKFSSIRGKFMSLLSAELKLASAGSEFFLTGILSSIDAILNRNMQEIIDGLPLTGRVKEALTGTDNVLRRLLDVTLDYEAAKWDQLTASQTVKQVGLDKFISLYLEAVNWQREFA